MMEDIQKLFTDIKNLRVGVIGDLMLDTYVWGKTDRISPEAPVPVVVLDRKEYRVGGAGNVALNCKSLGAEVSVFSVLGNDEESRLLRNLLEDHGVNTNGIVASGKRITTNKTRVISRNQQMMRIDAEISSDLDDNDEKGLLISIKEYISKQRPAVIIFEDYNKGVLTEKLIGEIINHCTKAGVITAVDPKRKNFFAYRQVDIFKPNLKEVREALNLLVEEISPVSLQSIHTELHHTLEHSISLITLSDKGVYYQQGKQNRIIPSHLRNIADVSGAGDTVIAVAALVYAATKNTHLMAEVANIAGGLVCEEVGTVAVSAQKLQHECEVLLS